MSLLTQITRRQSNEKTDEIRPILYTQVLQVLNNGRELTAREIALEIGRHTRQDIQPRLNELRDKHKLIEEARFPKYDKATNRHVTAYKLVEKGQ